MSNDDRSNEAPRNDPWLVIYDDLANIPTHNSLTTQLFMNKDQALERVRGLHNANKDAQENNTPYARYANIRMAQEYDYTADIAVSE